MITFRMTTVLAKIPAPAALAVRPDGARCSGVAVALRSGLIRAIDKFYAIKGLSKSATPLSAFE